MAKTKQGIGNNGGEKELCVLLSPSRPRGTPRDVPHGSTQAGPVPKGEPCGRWG